VQTKAELLLVQISKVKEQLYPLINAANELNESARPAANDLASAYTCLDGAAATIMARGTI